MARLVLLGQKGRSGTLFAGVNMSAAMHDQICDLVNEKYQKAFEKLQKRHLLEFIPGDKNRFLLGNVLDVGASIERVDGTNVSIAFAIDCSLFGSKNDLHPILTCIQEKFLSRSDLVPRNNALLGGISLPEEPYRLPTPHNGSFYFLGSEKEKALEFLERHCR